MNRMISNGHKMKLNIQDDVWYDKLYKIPLSLTLSQ